MKKHRWKKHRKKPPAFRDLVMTAIPFDEKKQGSLRLDLTIQELGAIGYVITQWALLEHELFIKTATQRGILSAGLSLAAAPRPESQAQRAKCQAQSERRFSSSVFS